jgi:hypothetical protein
MKIAGRGRRNNVELRAICLEYVVFLIPCSHAPRSGERAGGRASSVDRRHRIKEAP